MSDPIIQWRDDRYRLVDETETHLVLEPDRELTAGERRFGSGKPIRLHKRLARQWEAADDRTFERVE